MRRKEKEMDAKFAFEVIDKAPYVTLSMTRPDGTPYGVPVSAVRVGDDKLYFHCAHEGEKIDCLKANPVVSVSAVTKCAPSFEEPTTNFTVHYRSAIAIGRAEIVDSREEKIMVLKAICERFLPRHMQHFDAAIARSLDRTAVVCITLLEPPVGKRKELGPDGQPLPSNVNR